ncbi:hypothetical protein Acr_20g0008340 [Actinidia rufa]|uniref:Uncharacterized protein n=1 Tax=Actinidia rufa TaxID=165716 RepID=A0A7J0GDY1_9ERIC|nr:hypothetical protein Acr_20g0008340 [Actinidia rufa]
MTTCMTGMEYKWAFVDGGASINAMPLSTFRRTEIFDYHMVKQPTTISGFGGDKEQSLGAVFVNLIVGNIRSTSKFHVIDTETSYHVILGRMWQQCYGMTPSSYHQCMKAIMGGEQMIVGASERPFDVAEAHFDKAVFFIELLVDDPVGTTKPRGVKIPQ